MGREQSTAHIGLAANILHNVSSARQSLLMAGVLFSYTCAVHSSDSMCFCVESA